MVSYVCALAQWASPQGQTPRLMCAYTKLKNYFLCGLAGSGIKGDWILAVAVHSICIGAELQVCMS